MRYSAFRHVAAAGSLALIALIPLAACGDPSVSPRPAQAAADDAAIVAGQSPGTTPGESENPRSGVARPPTGQSSATTRPAAPASTRSTPTKPPSTKPTSIKPTSVKPTSAAPTGTCYGAVRHDLDLRNTVLDLVKSMCFHTGGVLRLQGIGPGLVTATPGSLVSQSYEAGVVDLRFLRAGTVTVTIPQDGQTYTITVVVVS